MWYVNKEEITYKGQCKQSFILTMWYLNFYNCRLLEIINIGFILTMWYVNDLGLLVPNKKYAVLY